MRLRVSEYMRNILFGHRFLPVISLAAVLGAQTPLLDLSPAARAAMDLGKQAPSDKKNLVKAGLQWSTEGNIPVLKLEAQHDGRGYTAWRIDTLLGPEAPILLSVGSELRFKVKALSGISRMALRVYKKGGEVLQFQQVRDLGAEWKWVSWKMEDASVAVSWGPKTNGRLELPAAEMHLAIDAEGSAALLIAAIEAQTAPGAVNPLAPVAPARMLCDFEPAEQARRSLPLERPDERGGKLSSARLEYSDEKAASGRWCLKASHEAEGGNGASFWLLDDFITSRELAELKAGGEIRMRLMALAGSPKLRLRFTDGEGENIQTKAIAPGPGIWTEARFPLTEAFIAQPTWGANANGRYDMPLKRAILVCDATGSASYLVDRVEYVSPETVLAEKSISEFRELRKIFWAKKAGLSFTGIPAFAVFTPGDAPRWTAQFRTEALEGHTWEWAARDPRGQISAFRPLPSSEGRWGLALPVSQFGPLGVEVRARKGDDIPWSTNLAYSVVHPISWKWKPGEVMLGICTHIEGRLDNWSDLRGNAGAEIARLYKYLGVSHDRGELVAWPGVEPSEGQFDWARKDRVMSYLKELGVRVFHIYAYATKWASTGDVNSKDYLDWARAAPRTEAFAAYCKAVAARYKDQIDCHEIWNEPNWGFWKSPTSMFPPLAIAAKRAIQGVDPGKPVVVGGYAQGEWGKIEEIVKGTVAEFPHAAFHVHGSFEEMDPAWQRYWNVFSKYGYKAEQLIDSETGWTSVSGGAAITNQALILIKKYAHQLSRGVQGVMLYDLLSDGPMPNEGEHHYGIVSWDRTVKPAYSAYNFFIHQLGGARAVKATDISEALPLTQFQQGSDRVALVWNQKDNLERPARLSGFPGEAQVFDLYGNPVKKIKSGDGFSVTGMPIWIRIQGFDGKLRLDGGRLQADVVLGAPAGEWAELSVSWIEELGGKTLRLSGAGLSFAEDRASIASGEKSKSLRVKLSKGDAICDGRLALMDGERELESLAFRMVPAPRLSLARAVLPRGDAGDSAGLEPVLARQARDGVRELLLFVGGNDNEPWTGPQDLSGRLWVASDRERLDLMVEVQDDKAVEPGEKPEEMWRADSIQVALDGGGRLFEIGAAVRGGKTISHAWLAPSDATARLGEIKASATRIGEKTYYALSIPLSLLGRKPGQLVGVSVLVNDADKRLRKQFLEFGGGIGFSKDPDQYLKFTLNDGK